MTLPDGVMSAMLDLARNRHIAITSDDFEAYAAADDAMTFASERLLAVDIGDLTAEDFSVLNELIALETASSRTLGDLTLGVSARLGELAAKGRTNSAYLRSERSSVNGL